MTGPRRWLLSILVPAGAAALFLGNAAPETQGQRPRVLRIAASCALSRPDWTAAQEDAAIKMLEGFIRDQTRMENKISKEKDWRAVVGQVEQGRHQLAVLAGYEFAWAQVKCPRLKPLALVVNGPRYPVVCVMTRAGGGAAAFSALRGQSLALPPCGQNLARRFVEREAKAAGQELAAYFSRIVAPDNIEDALDGVVDGSVQAAAVAGAGLEAYRRRKPGRARHLKEVARSQPFPPVVVAYYAKSLDAPTLDRFRDGLLGARRKQEGETLLMLFRLTGFEEVPRDFDRVLAEARKAYPPDAE